MNTLSQTNIEKVYFDDIAGYQDEKNEAKKIVEIFRNYEALKKDNVSIPAGLILVGLPGTGKTMLAKAIATESNVPFFEFEACEDATEAKTIKSLKDIFNKAREAAPSIIFIDELDELVSGVEFQSDYSRKVLKILLSEIDGAKSNNGVMVISTTNFYENINPALLRSGRIDKKIEFELPDFESRVAIFDLYLKKCNITTVSSKELANKTIGFSGADIKNLVNEALIHSRIFRKDDTCNMEDFDESIAVIRFKGIKKTNVTVSDTTKYHEIGHFLAGYLLTGRVGEISLESHGNVRGNVLYFDEEEFEGFPDGTRPKSRYSEEEINSQNYQEQICIGLAGYAAEQVMLNRVTLGSTQDIKYVKNLILKLLGGGIFGLEYLSFTVGRNPLPERVQDKAIEVLQNSLDRVTALLNENKNFIEYIKGYFENTDKLTNKELKRIIASYNVA